MAALLPTNVDYTARDFRNLRLRLQGLIRSVYPDWTEFNVAGFGNIMLESFAYVGDILAFYQDTQARELFWPTVTQRVNAQRLGRLINYTLPSARPATGTIRFSLAGVHGQDIPIPADTRVRTPEPNSEVFRTTVAATLTSGSLFVDVAIEQAELITGEQFASTAGPNQRFATLQAPYIDDTMTVTASDGTYTEVNSFLDNDPLTGDSIDSESKVFVVLTDPFDRAVILFGNGQAGKIPEGTIDVTYKIGGGVDGNVDDNSIIVLEDSISDVTAAAVNLNVTNQEATSGGVDATTVLQARAEGPRSTTLIERSVQKSDFEFGALEVPGVARAAMITSNEDGTVAENTGVLIVVAQGEQLDSGRIAPATPSTTMLADVLNKVTVERPPTLTFTVTTAAAPFRSVNVSTRVFLESGSDPVTVGTAIRANVQDFFAALLTDGTPNPAIDFGANVKDVAGAVISEIAWSDVFNAVRDTSGVRKVDEGSQGLLLNGLRLSVSLNPRDFPTVGTIQIEDADTGAGL